MPIEIDLHNNTSQIKVRAKSNEPIEVETGSSADASRLERMIRKEIVDRIAGDEYLQSEIDEIIAGGARYLLIEEKDDGSIDISLLNSERETLNTQTITLTKKIIKSSILDYEHSKIIYTCNDESIIELDISDIVNAIISNTNAIANERARAESVEENLQSQINELGGDTRELREDLDAEILRATNREAELQTSIDNEGTARQNFDIAIDARVTTLESGLSTETQNRIDADNTLQTNINSEASTRATEITRVEGLISDEASARSVADNALDDKIDLEIQNRIDDVNAEETRAKGVESTLDTKISDETTRATTKENALEVSLNEEISTREDEITRVEGLISTETSRATTVEETLQSNIDSEASTRATVDSTLNTKIETETTRATNKENEIAQNLSNEITRATGVETSLSNAIEAEETRAKGVENSLSSAISTETTRATTAEQAITTRIDNLDLEEVGSNGSYIKLISQSNGQVSASSQAFDTSFTNASNNNAPTTKTVKDYVDTFGGKIDSISINGVNQPIVNKNVDLPAYPTRESLNIDNVDNTSDLNKPISTATQSALDLKADKANTYTKTETNNLLDTKQDEITSTNKLNADLVDDSTSTHKFVTSSLINDINANTSARHTHSNKSILDNTTASFTTSDETKLDNIEAGAQVNVIESISINGIAQTITNKNVDLPTIHDVSLNTTTGSESITIDNSTLNVVTRDTTQTISGEKTFSTAPILNNNVALRGKDTNGTPKQLVRFNTYGNVVVNGDDSGRTYIGGASLSPNANETKDLGESAYKWKDLYLSGDIKDDTHTYTLPDNTGTFALVSDLPTKLSDLNDDIGVVTDVKVLNTTNTTTQSTSSNESIEGSGTINLHKISKTGSYSDLLNKPTIGDATLTIQKNSTTIDTFSANATNNKTIDISVPTKTSDITNDSGFITKSVNDLTNYSKTSEFGATAFSNSYNDLDDKPTIGNATLTIQKNGTSVGTFTANSTSDKTINIGVPTKTSDITNDGDGTSAFATEDYVDSYGGKIDSISINGTPQTIDANKNVDLPAYPTKASLDLGNVVNTGDSATPVSGGTTKFTTGGAYTLQTTLQDNIDDVSDDLTQEISDRQTADTTIDNKLNVNVHTIDTSDSEFIYDTTSPSTLLKKTTYKNLKSGTSGTKTEAIPLADSSKDGLMSHTDYNQIQTNTSRIEQLEGQTKRLLYSDSTNPSQQDIQDFVDDYLESIGITPSPSEYTGIAVVIANTYHIWHYYNDGTTGWKDDGLDTVTQFTNSIAGIILGSTTDGKVYAENDGTGSVNGWDALKTRVSNVETGMVSNVSYDTTNKKITKTINGTTSDVVSASTLKTDMSLNNVENGAQINKIETIKVNGTTQTITNKAVDISMPTKLSDLTDDLGVVTDVKTLNTTATTSQATNANESIEGSGKITLHKVSKTGSYTDLLDKPSISNDTITIKQTGISDQTFSLNGSTTTITLVDTNSYPTAFAWTNGTTSGPTGSLTGAGGMSAVSFGAIPSASASQSGVVTTNNQNFAGAKNFRGGIESTNITFRATPGDSSSTIYGSISYNGMLSNALNIVGSNDMYITNGPGEEHYLTLRETGIYYDGDYTTPGSELATINDIPLVSLTLTSGNEKVNVDNSSLNVVTRDTNQDITGIKTFDSTIYGNVFQSRSTTSTSAIWFNESVVPTIVNTGRTFSLSGWDSFDDDDVSISWPQYTNETFRLAIPAKSGTFALTSDITITSAAEDILDATITSKALKYAPYTSKGAGHLYTGTSAPTNSNRLNYDGNFYATKLYSGESEVLTSHQAIKNLNTNNSSAQTVSSNEDIIGSGTINLHKIAKTGSYSDLLNKPTNLVTTDGTQTITGKKTFTYTGGLYIGSDTTGAGTLNIYDRDVSDYAKVYVNDDIWYFRRDEYSFTVDTNDRTFIITKDGTSKYYYFPDNTGTVALTSDLPQVIDLRP